MADNKNDADANEIFATEAELEEALCVLAGSDPENCSYSRGYVKRQAVFACKTCTPSAAEPAGICLACANKCHDGHNIFELYTKRFFRCDCGNGKFGEFQCQLIPTKDKENVKNLYNHNFNGCYCTCDQPYPGTEDQENEEMIQCVICEDWLHSGHLGCTVTDPDELEEMVCESCMNKAPFLWTYASHFAVPPVISLSHAEEKEDVDIEEGAGKEKSSESSRSREEEASSSAEQTEPEEAENRSSSCKRTFSEMSGSPAEVTSSTVACRLKELQVLGLQRARQGAVFWPYSWRSKLCMCTNCKRAYVAAEVPFLMDQSDTILAYENRGRDGPFGQHPLTAVLNSMNHVQMLEVIYGLNELKTSITAFLQQCVAEGKTVTVEAVNEFFEELRARKRLRTNAGYQ